MNQKLSLIKNEVGTQEKKKLPHFPICYLTFKSNSGNKQVFEVKDISFSGMQLGLKSGEVDFKKGEFIDGKLHWMGDETEVRFNIIWQTSVRLGVEFVKSPKNRDNIDQFLTLPRFAKHLKPIHKLTVGIDLPPNLKYWLRADGPVEVFVWNHSNAAYQCFQILIMDEFVEWQDGHGLRTGRVLSKRDIDSPLLTEDEFVFLFDTEIDGEKRGKALELIQNVDSSLIGNDALEFLLMKLGH